MTIKNLEFLFRPKSVAVIGASMRPRSVGATVLTNLLGGQFAGTVMAVNPKYRELGSLVVYPDIKALPATPDLAVVCTPPNTVPQVISDLAQKGTKAGIVLTAGLNELSGDHKQSFKEAMLAAAEPHCFRILGPNCVGLIVPEIGLNASFAHTNALPGHLAFVSQSGALTTTVLDWAKSRGIGFSHFISLGDSSDVDFGDVLNYLARDPGTYAILLYAESITAARKFMSAARAAARNKPVIIVKAGRAPEGAKAATSHTGALAGADDVYDAAIRRAGMLRVYSTEELFDAAETLARALPFSSDRVTIITNGGGAGVLAADAVALGLGHLATLSSDTLQRLNEILPPTWSHANPVDIIGDAPVERYVDALKCVHSDPQSGEVILIHAPTAIVPSSDIATALAPVINQSSRNVFTCWLGADAVAQARDIFREAGIPTYDTPERAARAFLQTIDYQRNQDILMETPPSLPDLFTPNIEKARSIIDEVLKSGRDCLTEPEAKAVLAAYRIPIVETDIAKTPEMAGDIAEAIGFPVAIKILSPHITHKSDVGGVVLDLDTREAVISAAQAMVKRVKEQRPGADMTGFTVQSMVRRPHAFELIVGIATDPVFGPIILFGQGGTAVEAIGDKAIALPPLNLNLAGEVISRTRIARLLAGYRDHPAANHDAICLALMQLSQLVCDIPEISELDINPLLADESGVLALDARIKVVATATRNGQERLAIRPYPKELEEWVEWQGRQIFIRPIRPEDEPQHREFFNALSPEDIRSRFFQMIRDPAHSQLARMTQIDYDREMAFIAVERDEGTPEKTLGVVRAIADPDNVTAEFAITVRSDLKQKGLGAILMRKIVRYCQQRGTQQLVGETLVSNVRMLNLATAAGFSKDAATDGVVQLHRVLNEV